MRSGTVLLWRKCTYRAAVSNSRVIVVGKPDHTDTARGEVWAWEHPEEWIQAYYVRDQQVSADDGRRIRETTDRPYFPDDWNAAITWEQGTVDLVTESGYFENSFDADESFDRRFEKVAAESVTAPYRTQEAQ